MVTRSTSEGARRLSAGFSFGHDKPRVWRDGYKGQFAHPSRLRPPGGLFKSDTARVSFSIQRGFAESVTWILRLSLNAS